MNDNNQHKSNLPLHTRTHWRTIKSIINELGEYENITVGNYNLDSITCYECTGDTFKGDYVTCSSRKGRSAWVSDNTYEVFEAPSVDNDNEYKFVGDFLYLAHDVDYDYWLFGKSKDKLIYDFDVSHIQPFNEQYTCTITGRYIVIVGEYKNR